MTSLQPETQHASPSSSLSSSPSSRFSELSLSTAESAATSLTEDAATAAEAPKHVLVVAPPCDSSLALDAFLRALPLRVDAKEYLVLAMQHVESPSDQSGGCGRSESFVDAVRALGSALGDSVMFEHWVLARELNNYYICLAYD